MEYSVNTAVKLENGTLSITEEKLHRLSGAGKRSLMKPMITIRKPLQSEIYTQSEMETSSLDSYVF